MAGFGVRLARRCLNFSKSYIVLSIMIAGYGIVLTNLPKLLSQMSLLPATGVGQISTTILLPYFSIALIALSGLVVSTPVLLLFVYDKNNGVLEYLLSTGLDQVDLFSAYLRASLIMSSVTIISVNIANTVIGFLLGSPLDILSAVFMLSFVIGMATASFVTVSMIAFSSLQKTPMGANQPLGMALGMVPIFPLFVLPIVFEQNVFLADVILAMLVVALSIGLLLASGKLVLREKLLP